MAKQHKNFLEFKENRIIQGLDAKPTFSPAHYSQPLLIYTP